MSRPPAHPDRAGGRYRIGAGNPATVCDGEVQWEILRGVAPQWLLACYDLNISAVTQHAHRTAHRVTGVPPGAGHRARPAAPPPDQPTEYRSTRLSATDPGPAYPPTAVQAVADVQATPGRELLVVEGFTVG